MSKIYKFEGYVIDVNDDFNNVKDFLNYIDHISKYCDITAFNEKTSKEFEWDDNLEINKVKCKKEDLEKYFQDEESKVSKKNLVNKSNLKLDLSINMPPTNKSYIAKISDIIENSKDLSPEVEKNQIYNKADRLVIGKNDVGKNEIVLSCLPDKETKIKIAGYTEVSDILNINSDKLFYVDYFIGVVYFHSSQEGKEIVIIYKEKDFVEENTTVNPKPNKSFAAKITNIIESSKNLSPEEEKDYNEALNNKIFKVTGDNMFDEIIKIKVDINEDKNRLINILVNNGYKVWLEKEGETLYKPEIHYVCFNYNKK